MTGTCDYCEGPAEHTTCAGRPCCVVCWEEWAKDWTTEQQEELERMSADIANWLPKRMDEIYKELGVDSGMVCLRCRKLVQADADDNLFCDCHDERPPSPNPVELTPMTDDDDVTKSFDLELDQPTREDRLPADHVAETSAGRPEYMTKSGRDLREFDYELIMDRSGSMSTKDCFEVGEDGEKTKVTRWDYGRGLAIALAAKLVKFDQNGITIGFFNDDVFVRDDIATAAQVKALFASVGPDGGTDTAKMLKNRIDAFFEYRRGGGTKKRVIFVATDGAFNKAAVAAAIGVAQRKVETPDELSIQFLQVGNDESAEECLTYLDDNLGEPDLVDTTKFKEVQELTFAALVDKTIDD